MNTLLYRTALLTLFCFSNFLFAQGLPQATPDCVGLDESKLEAISDEIQRLVDNREMAGGVVLVAKDGKTVFKRAIGWSNINEYRPMQTDTLFRIASNTKLVTSFAIHLLWEDRALDFDDPVAWYIPEFADPEILIDFDDQGNYTTAAAANELTIRNLLNHTSGISYRANNLPGLGDIYAREGVFDGFGPTPSGIADIGDMVRNNLTNAPLAHEPGQEFAYGLSHDVLGHIVEVVSGQTLADFCKDNIFDPLEMYDTGFHVPANKVNRLAQIYFYDGANRSISELPDELTEVFPNFLMGNAGATESGDVYFSGGAGLVSTVDDMSRFYQMLLNKGKIGGACGARKTKIAKSKTVRELLVRSSQTAVSTDPGYEEVFQLAGHDFNNGVWFKRNNEESNRPTPEGTFGWAGLYNTHYFVDPENDIIAIVMSQVFPYLQFGLELKLEDAVYDALED